MNNNDQENRKGNMNNSDEKPAKDGGTAADRNSAARKSSSSIAVKLNMRMTGRLFAVISSINLLLIIFSLIFIGWTAEKTVSRAAAGLSEQPVGTGFFQYEIDKLAIAKTDVPLEGHELHDSFVKQLSRRGAEGSRILGLLPADADTLSVGQRVWALKYSLMTDIQGASYRLVYSVGSDLRGLVIIFLVLFGFELIILVSESLKSGRIIRKTLRPIYELAESARTLNEEVAALGAISEERQLEALAGVLSDIDANKLDRQIAVDSTQEELKGLASAINAMLRRINASYQSQVQFVSDASHELRTPISVIQGYVSLLDRWGKNDEKTMQESIDAIKAETQNMKELVEQLLFLARGDNETIQLHRESFEACEMIEEIVREAQMIDSTHSFELDLK
ncbi:MAG: sensor histidine kinase, partial [Clostridiaceae bacterium]|nr:sensor histidine kinase [Clostridiaceae bacterium]